MSVSKEKLLELQDPKTYKKLGILPKWRVGRITRNQAHLLPYHDSREVQTVLDSVCGQSDWCNEPLSINGKLYMQIGINIEGEGWVYKSDVGTESNIEKTKGEASDAIKRAAVMWGIFRDLYSMGEIVLPAQGKTPTTHNGKPLLTPTQLSAYCNNLNSEFGHLGAIYLAFKEQFTAHPEAIKALSTIKEFLTELRKIE